MMREKEKQFDAIAGKMKGALNRQMYVLELFCQTGQLSGRIAASVKSLEATDPSPEKIAAAKKGVHSARLHFSVQNAASLPYGQESFDAVVIADALHLLPEPEKVLAEIHRVLKPEGLLFAPSSVRSEGRNFLLSTGFKARSRWTAREFSAFVSGQGFSVTEQTLMGSKLSPLCYLVARRAG